MTTERLAFDATSEKGRVDALLTKAEQPMAFLVFGHGAGANMEHAHMQAITASLASVGISSLRFNFPFMQKGGGRTDPRPVCIQTIANAVGLAQSHTTMPIFLGGHSFGGRMASHAAAELALPVRGMIYYSFPLHPARKPDTSRADHMNAIRQPQLFVTGTRDALADTDLLEGVVKNLKGARLHLLETADHSFRILKRTRKSDEDVYQQAARATEQFTTSVLTKG